MLSMEPLFFCAEVKTKGMVQGQQSGCPVKRGEKCPYPDKKVCPYAKPAREKTPRPPQEKTVYLIGTVHVSKESARKVEDTIRTVLPGMVCMELDIERFRVMQQMLEEQKQAERSYVEIAPRKGVKSGKLEVAKPKPGAAGPGEGGHFRYSAPAGAGGPDSVGFKDMLTMPGLLKWLQQQIGEEFGVMPGSEMTSAYETARKYSLDIGLIDRPIGITLQRMWKSMGFKEKARLMGMLAATSSIFLLKPLLGKRTMGVMSMFGDERELDISKLEKGEGIDALMAELEKRFPSLHRALVDERNTHMCNSISHILREKADVLVVVVGMGHVSGMKRLLEARGVKVVV
jgi:pheromone shutdown protein TraB